MYNFLMTLTNKWWKFVRREDYVHQGYLKYLSKENNSLFIDSLLFFPTILNVFFSNSYFSNVHLF
jgi:hypothetical protein